MKKDKNEHTHKFPADERRVSATHEEFKKFKGQFSSFSETVLPVYIERHDANLETDKDPRLSSGYYFFVGEGIYAQGKVKNNNPDLHPYNDISDVVEAIAKKISDPSDYSVVVSTFNAGIRIELKKRLAMLNITYDGQVAYDAFLDMDFEIQLPGTFSGDTNK